MPNHVAHFAIHADDVERARAFYENVFDWIFTPWGPPDFYMIRTGPQDDPGIHGSLEKRRAPVEGRGMIGFHCSVSVESVDAIAASAAEHGGKVTFPKMAIPTVGWLVGLEDTEGNSLTAIRYDSAAH